MILPPVNSSFSAEVWPRPLLCPVSRRLTVVCCGVVGARCSRADATMREMCPLQGAMGRLNAAIGPYRRDKVEAHVRGMRVLGVLRL